MKTTRAKTFTFLRILLFLWLFFIISCASPSASFEVGVYEPIVPVSIMLKNTSEDADSCYWDFGNGFSSSDVHPDVRYMFSGSYTITLKTFRGKKSSVYTEKIHLNAPDKCLINMETNYGHMTFELFNETPVHRDHFLSLIHKGYYEGIHFHRVIRGFVVQAGDEKTRSRKKSHYDIKEGTLPSEIVEGMYHTRGALAMARQPDQVNPEKKSSSTQFYIVHGGPVSEGTLEDYEIEKDILYPEEIKKLYKNPGGSPQLDKEYTIFGHLIDGYDVLDKIAQASTDTQDKPISIIEIIRVTETR